MKTFTTFLICLFLTVQFQVQAQNQNYVASTTKLTKHIEESGKSYSATEIGLIRLNDQNNEFTFDIPLFQILTNTSNDSIISINKGIMLNFRAQFPIKDLDFSSNNSQENTFSVAGELTINNITLPVVVDMGIIASVKQENQALNIDSYPVRVSFVIEINPGDFQLDYETINFANSIVVEVRSGSINRATDNSLAK